MGRITGRAIERLDLLAPPNAVTDGWRYVRRQRMLKRERAYVARLCQDLASSFTGSVEGRLAFIPVFNNPTYTKRMCQQLRGIGIEQIFLLDSKSTTQKMLEVLAEEQKRGARIVHLPHNFGPHFLLRHQRLLDLLPKTFVLTDPDIQLNPRFPSNAIEVMADVSAEFRVGKVGLALDISQPESLSDTPLVLGGRSWNLVEWESQFWRFPLVNRFGLHLYAAEVDTIFAVYNLEFFRSDAMTEGIRVAGDFTATHLPWLKDAPVPPQELFAYRNTSRHSHWV